MGTSHKGGMLVGYARVSTGDQSLDLQEDALQEAGCGKLFTDIASVRILVSTDIAVSCAL
jgi:hypothetical protein